MKKFISTMLIMLLIPITGQSQCDSNVPLYNIDLSQNSDTTWILQEDDALNRFGQCCSAGDNENCIQFQITLNENSAGIYFNYDGAPAFGSLGWQIDCGPLNDLRDTICINGGGTYTLTFCKPGTDNGNYTLVSVPQPTFPANQFVPMNCQQPVEVLGLTNTSVSWQSVSPGTPGQYDYLLSCTDCTDPLYTPDPTAPAEIDFEICGYPILDFCVGNFNFCDTIKFTNLDSILMDVSPANPSFCSGSDVTLSGIASGGSGSFTFYWYDASLNLISVGPNLVVSSAGSYTCEARDNAHYDAVYCDHFTKTVAVVEVLPPSVNAGNDLVLCADNPDGQLGGTVQNAGGGVWSGGNGTFSPSINDLNAIYTPTQAELASGNVVLTLTSTGINAGCSNAQDLVTLFFVDTIHTDLNDIQLSCFGETVDVNPVLQGGMAPFTYSWTNGVSTLNNTLGNGSFCLTISDANGCQSTECLTISSPPDLNVSTNSTPASSDGGSDGTATATPDGGTAPFSYSWSNGGTSQTVTGLSYGIYTVTVTDANGCTRTVSVVVNEPRCNGFDLTTSSTSVLCNDGNTGSATVTTSGGQAPFNYVWNDGASQSTPTAINLSAGVYEIIVTDDNACIQVATASVFEPDDLMNTVLHTDVSTLGGSDGTATANVTGGSGIYFYSWSNGESTVMASNLSSGWHYLFLSDNNGCSLYDSVFINEPPCDEFMITVNTSSPLCNGDPTGAAALSIVNGVEPYSISWSSGETNINAISGHAAGLYNVEITDSRGCYTSMNFGINEPSALSVGLAATPSTCFGSDNGTIDMAVSGGTYPYYSFVWNNGWTSEDLINLVPGNYSVVVTDQNGCQANASTMITEPEMLTFTYTVQNVACYGGNTGAIDVTPSGGTIPYTFDWSNGATTEDLNAVDIGGYILTISDANFCNGSDPISIIVDEPEDVMASDIIVNCPVPGEGQTLVEIVPSGGMPDYMISFDGGLNFMSLGTYEGMVSVGQGYDIVISDAFNCLSLAQHIEVDDKVEISGIDFNKCYSPGQTDELINITVVGGTPDYKISYTNGSVFGPLGEYSLSLPINNSYVIVAQDSKECLSAPVEIILPDVLAASISATSDYNGAAISCFGLSDGQLTASVNGGTSDYTYLWNNENSSSVISNLEAGDYMVTITDDNDCIVVAEFTLTQPELLTSQIEVTSDYSGEDVSCNGMTNGAASIMPSGGIEPYLINWSNGQPGEDVDELGAGQYSAEITDANGCETTNSVLISEPASLGVELSAELNYHGHHINLYGGNDGSIDAEATGGTEPYTYSWSNGSSVEDPANLPAGTYSVLVTDENGCTTEAQIALTEPLDLALPTAFSPNEDGDNDSYEIRGIEAYPNNTLTIINRWGNVIYTEENYQNTWKGTNEDGEALPDGVYFLILEINSGKIEKNTYVQIKTH